MFIVDAMMGGQDMLDDLDLRYLNLSTQTGSCVVSGCVERRSPILTLGTNRETPKEIFEIIFGYAFEILFLEGAFPPEMCYAAMLGRGNS
ncbi:hypothetical protein SFRURICE_011593 [Spodoptera frugiperda]|nr:hypothetical protein SFRURICE_011593 [Spodoptera frugiperda]